MTSSDDSGNDVVLGKEENALFVELSGKKKKIKLEVPYLVFIYSMIHISVYIYLGDT